MTIADVVGHYAPGDAAVLEVGCGPHLERLRREGFGNLTGIDVNDDFPLYHRDWKEVFSERGFAQWIREPTSGDAIRVFRAV